MNSYQQAAHEFEPKWRDEWLKHQVFHTPNPHDSDFDPAKPRTVILDFFPYPSGIGLHIGHPLGYIATDILSRHMRMSGYNVLHSMGFDSFGLPAEQFAIQHGQHPEITTRDNMARMLSQLRYLGFDHDEDRRFSTTDPGFYKWTQWLFLKLFDSYYDAGHTWTDAQGREVHGRARPIPELEERLASGAWKTDANLMAGPAGEPRFQFAVAPEQMRQVIDQNRLAVLKRLEVNWCPMLGTVLSNEEVTNEGRSERGDYPVYKKPLLQWVLRITEYADRLISDLTQIDWPVGVVEMQRNWIGRSIGGELTFRIEGASGELPMKVFTTRPDTIFGVTFLGLAPDHPAVASIVSPDRAAAVNEFVANHVRTKASRNRDQAVGQKGIFTGAYARHPLSGERVPVWLADYILSEYGTGAIMAVPAHDTRDFAFAKRFGLPIKAVVQPPVEWLRANAPGDLRDGADEKLHAAYLAAPSEFAEAYADDGVAIQSSAGDASIDGLKTDQAIDAAITLLEQRGAGVRRVQYKLRDWLFSRQRYWGEPFPVVHDIADDTRVYAVDDSCLPVELPPMTDFRPVSSEDADSAPTPPLARATEWMVCSGVVLPNGRVRIVSDAPGSELAIDGQRFEVKAFRRDANTMPNWAGSCWYYLRYFDPKNDRAFVDPEIERYWSVASEGQSRKNGAVDLYVGGTEHAVLHLLYARFWHKVFYDLGLVSTPEPFQKLFNQGMITADAYRDARGSYVDIHEVGWKTEEGRRVPIHKETREELTIDPGKMGKRYKNGIPPEEVCEQYTADTLRCYEMYLGPLDQSKPWQSEQIVGVFRFLDGVWKLATGTAPNTQLGDDPNPDMERLVHRTIQGVTEELRVLRMNTALSKLFILYNALTRQRVANRQHVRALCTLLAPFAPHLAEELFQHHFELPAGVRWSAYLPWPAFDPALTVEKEVDVPIQVNGRLRDTIKVSVEVADSDLEQLAKQRPAVAKYLTGPVRKVIIVNRGNQKLVNMVV